MKRLLKRNYKSIVKRGLITKDTTLTDFLIKLDEEVNELNLSVDFEENTFDKLELADIILTCMNMAYHYDIDIIKQLEKKIKINENR